MTLDRYIGAAGDSDQGKSAFVVSTMPFEGPDVRCGAVAVSNRLLLLSDVYDELTRLDGIRWFVFRQAISYLCEVSAYFRLGRCAAASVLFGSTSAQIGM